MVSERQVMPDDEPGEPADQVRLDELLIRERAREEMHETSPKKILTRERALQNRAPKAKRQQTQIQSLKPCPTVSRARRRAGEKRRTAGRTSCRRDGQDEREPDRN